MTELSEMATQCIDHLSALPDKTLMGSIGNSASLVLRALNGHEVHIGPQCRLGNRCRIGGVILLPLDERVDVNRRDQPNLVSETLSEAPSEMAGRACFHRHDARGLRLHKLFQLRTRNCPII